MSRLTLRSNFNELFPIRNRSVDQLRDVFDAPEHLVQIYLCSSRRGEAMRIKREGRGGGGMGEPVEDGLCVV